MTYFELLGIPRWRKPDGTWKNLYINDAALLAMLAIDGPQPREVLMGRLWPLVSDDRAAANLRQRIMRLRKDTAGDIFLTGPTVALASDVGVDVSGLAKLSVDALMDAGDLLAAFDYAGNEFLEAWVASQRERLCRERADLLAGHAHRLEERGEIVAALRLAERIVALTPAQEHAWRRLMRLHYLRGDHTAAIEAFERFEALLREQTGARPGPETQRLLASIESASQIDTVPIRVLPISLARPPRRIGRQAEWLAMGRAWSGARAFLLVGEAGMGKSRLMGDFVQGRTAVVVERGRAGDLQTPYELLARLLRGVLASGVAEPVGFLREELSRLLPELGAAAQVPTQEASLRRAAETLLVAAIEEGLEALIVDDLQFADFATLEALRWLSASPALSALRFGFAARPLPDGHADDFIQSWLGDSHRPERIELKPLATSEVEELLASLELPDFVRPELGARLHAHAGGHPLFILETLKDAWLHQRNLRTDPLPAPQTVQTLIERRLRQLPVQAVDLVRVAAVSGADLTVESAAALLGVSPLQLSNTWAQLERANVLTGLQFAHDLMHDGALALVPEPLRRTLHAMVAKQLVADPRVPPGRVADHWHAAEQWAEAGSWWHRAGMAARLAGRLQEQQALLERAAACYRQAGLVDKEFEVVRASFDGLLLRHGGASVLAALPRLEALSRESKTELQCRLIKAEALLDLERGAEALAVSTDAVVLAADHPTLRGDALCLHGMALAQEGRQQDAVAACRHGADAAHAAALDAQELRAVRALAYVLYKNGRVGEALPVQRRAARLAQALGDRAEAAAAEASIAGLLAVIGDVPATLHHARRADHAYREMELAQNSTIDAINLAILGRAAAYLGRFDEALQALTTALAKTGDDAQVAALAKSRIALADIYLALGDGPAAEALLARLPAGTPPGMRMQAALLLARADQMEGGSGAGQLVRLGRLGAEYPDLPVVLSAWVEWSYQGDAATVVPTLRRVREAFESIGRTGTARTLLVREVARLAEFDDAESIATAARHAAKMLPHIGVGTCAAMYPPEGWLTIACALERAGRLEEARTARHRARAWITQTALPSVPEAARDAFLRRNPVNRELLSRKDEAGGDA